MDSAGRHFTAWLDLAAELVRHPGREFPRTLVSEALVATFGTAVAWNWMTADGRWGMEAVNAPDDLLNAHLAEWEGERLMTHHPLVRWYQATRDPRPMSMDRVPDAVAPSRAQAREQLRALELEEQLSIPYQLDAGTHLAFVLGRTGDEFHKEHLSLAARIQPLICLAARQYAVLDQRPAAWDVGASHGLTGREVAVLTLVGQSLTAGAVAHRLGISPRTVHKHLEHVCTKLGVPDRLTAVLVARQMGLCGAGVRAGPSVSRDGPSPTT